MTSGPLVSIVIPHLRGREILLDCLESLLKTTYANQEVILVDNGSEDGSVEAAKDRFPSIRVVRNETNLGYAGGCNAGYAHCKGKYILFLNDDVTTLDASWLGYLVETCEADPLIAACQPKLLSSLDKGRFDYAGGAGGLIDRLGFPFARGRLFFTMEEDQGQYDSPADIFWASGTAMFCRKSVMDEVGVFDEDFFAHQEEIDLCWRFQLAGYRLVAEPRSVVFHRAGTTLETDSFLKIYLNHRNNLVMLMKNYQCSSLLWVVPLRLLFEGLAFIYAILKLDFDRIRAVFGAFFYIVFRLNRILAKRRATQNVRKVTDARISRRMYQGMIVVDYFFRGIRSVRELGEQRL